MGVLVSAALFVAAPLFTDLLGMQGETRAIAIHYLRLDSLCYFFTGFTLVGGSILRASGDTRTPMLIYAIVSVFNVFAAYSFVYGAGPIPSLGVSGIVIGTVCARVFGGLLIVAGFARGFHGLRLSLREWKLRGETVGRILRIGIPAAADGALAWVGIFLFLMVVSRGTSGVSDEVTLAAHVVGVRVGICRRGPGRAGAGSRRPGPRPKGGARRRPAMQPVGRRDVDCLFFRGGTDLRLHAQ
jgi:Na+-driven multidrug efflux pump